MPHTEPTKSHEPPKKQSYPLVGQSYIFWILVEFVLVGSCRRRFGLCDIGFSAAGLWGLRVSSCLRRAFGQVSGTAKKCEWAQGRFSPASRSVREAPKITTA